MRAGRLGYGLALVALMGCGGPAPAAFDGGSDRDASPTADGEVDRDSGSTDVDAGPGMDGGVMPEVCTGGIDEDGDTQVDCDDDACWTFDACIAADVGEMVPGAVRCGDAIELDAATNAEACATIGVPEGSTYPVECMAGTIEVTAYVFCDASGLEAALWIEERLEMPETSRMLTPRSFEHSYFERATPVDYERHTSGPGAFSGPLLSIHEGQDRSHADRVVFHVISVRPVMPNDTIARLLGMSSITSIVDLDAPMSMDTRRVLHAGGLFIVVPHH